MSEPPSAGALRRLANGLAEGGRHRALGGRSARGRRAPLAVRVTAIATAGLACLPLVYLFVRAVEGGWDGYASTVFSPLTARLLLRTLLLAGGVAGLSVALGLPLAWLVTRSDLPGRRAWAVLAALPLAVPSYLAAYCLVAVLGPRGYLQGLLAGFGVERLPELAYGYTGALLALGLFNYPYVYLLAAASLRSTDPALEESSRSLGRGPWGTFFGVALPQLRGALVGGTLLVSFYTFADFGAVSIARYNTFTLGIYNAYRALFDRTVAASLGTVLVLLTLALLALQARLAPARPGAPSPPRRARPVPLGRWRIPCLAAVAGLHAVTLGVPLVAVAVWSARALALGHGASGLGGALLGSLAVAGPAALIAVALSLPVAVWSVRYPGAAARRVERLTGAGYALPGLVVALALVFFCVRFAPWLYQSLALVVLACVLRFLPQATAAARGGLAAVSPRLEEAARSLGRRPREVLATLVVPLARPSVAAGAGLVFLTTIKELPATLLLRPAGFETLATRVWTGAAEGIYSQAALPALALLAVSAPAMALLLRAGTPLRGEAE